MQIFISLIKRTGIKVSIKRMKCIDHQIVIVVLSDGWVIDLHSFSSIHSTAKGKNMCIYLISHSQRI